MKGFCGELGGYADHVVCASAAYRNKVLCKNRILLSPGYFILCHIGAPNISGKEKLCDPDSRPLILVNCNIVTP